MTLPAEEPSDPGAAWYADHIGAGEDVVRIFGEAGVEVRDKRIADIGCGDGIIDLAIARAGAPAELVGYDVNRTDPERLLEQARRYGGIDALPAQLRFEASEPEGIPAPDAAFDLAVTWSAFEHIQAPLAVAREIRRILAPGGVLFLQLWPFYASQHGSHLMDWFPEGFVHLVLDDEEIKRRMDASEARNEWWREYMFNEYRDLNRISLDELQRVVLAAGFDIASAEPITNPVMLRPELGRYPLSELLIAGIKLLAVAR
jgi:ubiquinone/menaquinone biosynthesis C-methylase UbiE